MFDIAHAMEYGVDEAIMIQNFQFWITKNKANTGFISSMEKARLERIERERQKRQADNLERIRRDDISHEIKHFVKEFCRGGEK